MGENVADCFPLRLGLGMYYYRIIRWLATVPRERFLSLRTEDLATDPYSSMQRVWEFLELTAQTREDTESLLSARREWNSNHWIKSEPYRDRFAMLPQTEQLLDNFYRPHNNLLAQLLSGVNSTQARVRLHTGIIHTTAICQNTKNCLVSYTDSECFIPALNV